LTLFRICNDLHTTDTRLRLVRTFFLRSTDNRADVAMRGNIFALRNCDLKHAAEFDMLYAGACDILIM
jgi:hypothetical protein